MPKEGAINGHLFLNALDTKNREQFDLAINALQGDVAAAARLSIDPPLAP
jgi:hypothetical protein